MMRRNACLLWAWIALVPLFAGCSLFQKKEPMTDVNASSAAVDAYDPSADPYSSTGGYDNYGGAYGNSYGSETASAGNTPAYPASDKGTADAYTPPSSETASYENTGTYASGGSRYHTVQRKDTLYNLARQYYNDERSWKKIYQANSDVIHDPNQIYPGQKLLIP